MAFYSQLLKKGASYASLLAGLGSSVAYIYPHTYGLDDFIEETISRTHGVPDEVDKDLKLTTEILKEKLEWGRYGEMAGTELKFIPSKLIEFSHQGSMASRWGGVIGVPGWFLHTSEEQKNKTLWENGIDITTDNGQQIAATLKLSPEAQRFILAREMTEAKSTQVFFNAGAIGFSFPFIYFLSATVSQFLPFPGAKLIAFCMSAPLVGIACVQGVDAMNRFAQSRADTRAAGICKRTAEGGVQFYDSLIVRTSLMEDVGNKKESQDNSSLSFLKDYRMPSLSLSERRQLLLNAKEKLYGTDSGD